MSGNTRALRRGASILPNPPFIMGSYEDGLKSRGMLLVGLPGLQGGYTGVPDFPHHLQDGGGCGGAALGRGDGRGRGWAGQARIGGQTLKFPLLRE